MATFTNQATLTYRDTVVNSNVVTGEILEALAITKNPLTSTYGTGDEVTYVINVTNSGATALTDLTLTDDLGEYDFGTGTLVPLTYVTGTLNYYLNGVLQPAPTVTALGDLTVSNIDLPGNSTATFIYEARANGFAPLAAGSEITNTASTDGGIGIGVISDTATVGVAEEPRLSIAKAVCPDVVTDNGTLTYTIILQNLGNTAIVATDGAIVSDNFNPALSGITVSLDGAVLVEGVGYTYNEATGEFATLDGVVTVPAATYTQDPVTGAITVTPGVTVLTVTGTV